MSGGATGKTGSQKIGGTSSGGAPGAGGIPKVMLDNKNVRARSRRAALRAWEGSFLLAFSAHLQTQYATSNNSEWLLLFATSVSR